MAITKQKVRRGCFRIYAVVCVLLTITAGIIIANEWKAASVETNRGLSGDLYGRYFEEEEAAEHKYQLVMTRGHSYEEAYIAKKLRDNEFAAIEEKYAPHLKIEENIVSYYSENMEMVKYGAAIVLGIWTVPFILHLVIEWIVVGFRKG